MPKIFFALFFFLFAAAALPGTASAAFEDRSKPDTMQVWLGGFDGPGFARISVEQARVTRPATPVIVRGNILQYVGTDLYVFEDNTSSILVTIPEDSWGGQVVTPENTVELEGELQKLPTSVRIRVAKLTKVQ